MDIKWKSSKKLGIILLAILFLFSLVNVLSFPGIVSRAEERYVSDQGEQQKEINQRVLQSCYQGAYVLYYEQTLQTQETIREPADLFLKQEKSSTAAYRELIAELYRQIERDFETYRYKIDYYASNGKMSESNTSQELSLLAEGTDAAKKVSEELLEYYVCLFGMHFDEMGQMQIQVVKAEEVSTDGLIKSLKQIDANESMVELLNNDWNETTSEIANKIQNFTVIFGISDKQAKYIDFYEESEYSSEFYYYLESEAAAIFGISLAALAALAFALYKAGIRNAVFFQKKHGYVLEAAVFGALILESWYSEYCGAVHSVQALRLTHKELSEFYRYPGIILSVFFIFTVLYVIFTAFCPVFELGVKEYISRYSFFYQLFLRIKQIVRGLKEEVAQMDFGNQSRKTIMKIIVVNFVVLAVITCMWFFGIAGLIIYSFVLYFVIIRYYSKIQMDYQKLLQATNRIAEGDLNTVITDDIGIFEPVKEELTKIQLGFKKAVDEEVKSQRMKTELITNVSHDLKTPLTAITTYVTLLKKEHITEEERKDYVETLERKALRLKVLIEDLFEVSKLNSNNITLNLVKMDLVNLIKQVAIEHENKYEDAGIRLCWNIPEGKTELFLDSQKTYRIFENLFVNIQKYAMRGSRVYIDVTEEADKVMVVLKNMSAAPLNVAPEELTERFVRGDASRNTEGSGLGLAIAKSLTEAQKGNFTIVVDGDLFKTILVWNKKLLSE